MEELRSIRDLNGIVRRRKTGFILCFSFIFIAAVVIAFLLPPIYLSKSTILIENQQIPQDFVKSTITSFVEERLHMIKQQVMSRSRLMEIVNRFSLYRDMSQRYTTEDIVEKMRDDIKLETISADVMNKRTGRPTAATIAFTLSYEGKHPSTVQKVANVLASLYLEENLRAREQQASNTISFLEQELDEIKEQLDRLQNKIAEFKQAHYGELPEFSSVNLQAMARLNRDLEQVNMQIRSLKERKILLEGQLANVDPLMPVVTADGKTIMNPSEHLKYLRLQLISLQGGFTENHPDIIRLKQSIREMETQVESSDDSMDKVRRLNDLNGQLASLKGNRGPKHPDVIRLSSEVQSLSKEVEGLKVEKARHQLEKGMPDNPIYINLMTQIASTEMEIGSLIEDRKQIKGEIVEYQKKLESAPLVEKEYNNLMGDYANAKYKYNEIMNELMEARVSQGMEESQRGERFTLIEPAQFPEKPYKPNRIAIVIIGFVLALGAGVGIAAIRETLDISIKSADELMRLTGAPVLSVIPEIVTDGERWSRRIRRAAMIFAWMGAVAVGLYIVHLYVMPLEILWIKVQKRMMMSL